MAILLLFALVQIDPNQKYLDYLSSSLVDHNGVRMDIKWSQVDGDKSWSQVGVIELHGNRQFFLDTDQQSIKIDNNQIITFYKINNGKIIYDTMIQGGYGIFDFLSGDFSGFTISNLNLAINSRSSGLYGPSSKTIGVLIEDCLSCSASSRHATPKASASRSVLATRTMP